MPRKPAQTPPPAALAPAFNEEAAALDFAAANQLALAQRETDGRVRAVAQQMGYQLPVESCDPDLIQRDIAANMRRSVEACLEVGRGLRVLKEACGHGNFMARLEVLGIEASVARRFMEAAVKFTKRATSHVLTAAGSQSKLLEMLVLDDEQIEELELTGETGDLRLDDVATMSVKELRAAVRKERAETAKQKAEVQRQAAVITELHDEARRIKRATPDEAQAALHAEAATVLNEVLGRVRGDLRAALAALSALPQPSSTLLAGMLGQVQAELLALRDELGLPDLVGDGAPEWQKWAAAHGVDA